uniref:EF-hand domain-containing protein n=1 Tax=Parastrongyloides trichosuri TaxID=131310 RepID=A0A0N4ZZ48_PARTI
MSGSNVSSQSIQDIRQENHSQDKQLQVNEIEPIEEYIKNVGSDVLSKMERNLNESKANYERMKERIRIDLRVKKQLQKSYSKFEEFAMDMDHDKNIHMREIMDYLATMNLICTENQTIAKLYKERFGDDKGDDFMMVDDNTDLAEDTALKEISHWLDKIYVTLDDKIQDMETSEWYFKEGKEYEMESLRWGRLYDEFEKRDIKLAEEGAKFQKEQVNCYREKEMSEARCGTIFVEYGEIVLEKANIMEEIALLVAQEEIIDFYNVMLTDLKERLNTAESLKFVDLKDLDIVEFEKKYPEYKDLIICLESSMEERKELFKKFDELKTQLHSMEQVINSKTEKLENLENEFRDCKVNFHNLNKEIKEIKKRSMNKALELDKAILDKLHDENETLAKCLSLSSIIENDNEEVKSLKDELNKTIIRLEKIKERNNQSLLERKKELNKEIERMSIEIKKIKKEISK